MSEDKDTQPLNIHIAVENFGPIEKAEIDLRPLTVFVGESNTGKTYLAALIYALHHAFEGISQVPWSAYRIRQLNSIYPQHRSPSTQPLPEETQNVLKKLKVTGQPFKFSDLPSSMHDQLQSDLVNSKRFDEELRRCFDLEFTSELIRFTQNQNDAMKISLNVCKENQNLWIYNINDSGSGIRAEGFISEDTILRSVDRKAVREILDPIHWEESVRVFSWKAEAKSYYLPAARSGIMQSHGMIASSLIDRATRVGLEQFSEIPTFSGMIADFLKQIINYGEHHIFSDEMSGIAKLLEDEVLRGKIEANRPAEVGYPQFRYSPLKSEKSLLMSQTSSMVSELAPLVLFLRGVVKPGDTLIIEEPEAHLHPKAQTKIAITLARLVRAGVRVIITTHSDWLLQQIGNLIREGELNKQEQNTSELPHWLSKEEVGAWWFHTDKPVEEIPFDRIEGIEPRDYEDVADGLYNNFVELERQFLKEEAVSEDE